MKVFFKKTIAFLLTLLLTLGSASVMYSFIAQKASATVGSSSIKSYAELAEQYDNFLYLGTEAYETVNENLVLSDGYVQPGDLLTFRLFFKSDRYIGASMLYLVCDFDFFDNTAVTGAEPNSSTGFTEVLNAVTNNEHPMVSGHDLAFFLTSNQANNVPWIKNICAIDVATLQTWGTIQILTETGLDSPLSTQALRLNSDLWMMEFYLTVREGLEEGTKGTVRTEFELWEMSANPKTGVAPDIRKRANIDSLPAPAKEDDWDDTVDELDCYCMADEYDGIEAFLYDDLYHEFTIGDNPDDTPVKVKPSIKTYAELAEQYDNFIYLGTEAYEAVDGDLVLSDGYVQPGDLLTFRLYFKSDRYIGASMLYQVCDFDFFDNTAVTGNEPNGSTGYTEGLNAVANNEHPMVSGRAMTFSMNSNQGSNVAWIEKICAIDTTELAKWGTIQIFSDSQISLALRLNSNLWMMEFYLKVREGLEEGTKGTIRTEFDLWQLSENPTTGVAPDRRKRGNIYSLPAPASEELWCNISQDICENMASQFDSIQAFLYDDLYHEFTIGENPYRIATFTVDGKTYGEEMLYLPGSSIDVPKNLPAKPGYKFLGWALDGTTDVLTFPQTMGSANVVYSAVFEALPTHTATFMVDGAVYGDVVTYTEGATITAPADPTKTGYSFTGWSPTVGTMGTADMVFNATFKANTYSVKYYKEKTNSTPYQTLSVSFDGAYNLPATPTKTGYVFSGWVDASGNSMPATHTTDADVSFYALWTAGSYDAVFNANGGQFADGTTKKNVATDFDSEIVAPENPSRLGYDFAGWTPSVGVMDDVNGKTFSAKWAARNDTKYTVETYTMNAVGEYDKVTITFNGITDETIILNPDVSTGFTLNSEKSILQGTVSADNSLVLKIYLDRNKYTFTSVVDGETTETEYLYGSIVAEPTTPVKTGYTFAGWTPEVPALMPAEDLSITAVFTANSYDAIFKANGGAWSDGETTKTVTTDFDSEIIAPENPSRQGYDFAGWDSEISIMDTEGNTFTAQWTARNDTKYTVETYTMNTEGEYDKVTVTFNGTTNDSIILNPDVSTGFSLNSEKSVIQGTVTADNSLVLKIYLDRNIYTITKIVNGETTEAEYLYGSIIAEPVTPVKTGYTFAGWTPEIPATMPAEDFTVTAQFTANSYDAVFDANGGAWSDGETTKTVTTDFDSEIIAPENPSRQGYDFAGWDSEISIMDTEGNTFTAQWTARNDTKYTVETYTMNTEGEYDKVTVTFNGATDDSIILNPDVSTGFSLNSEKSVLQGTAFADNSLVLKIYLDRNIYTIIKAVDGETTEVKYLYGSTIAEPATPVKTGYSFTGWDKTIPVTMPAEDLTVTAQFTVNSYDAVFNANGGKWSDGATTKTVATDFDSEIVAPENPSRQGYDFAGWTPSVGIMDTEGKTFTAQWTARNDTEYTVETYTMDIYGKYSVAKETKKGTTDTEATVTANAQPGFTFNNAKSKLSGNIAGDGSLVLSVYYDRNTYTFTTVVEGKTTSNSYYFDAPVTMPANPVKSGYKFTGWDKPIPAKMPANNVTVIANFELSFKMSIRNSSTTTIKYGDKIILHADMNEALPNGWTIKWTADNGNFSYSVSADSSTCTISPSKSGSTNFKTTAYDEKGNVICEDTQSMTSKAGFFDKIGAFFRKLFGSTKTIPQLFKGIF